MFPTPRLEIDLAAITANWLALKAQFTGDEVSAVVKADAYGLGAAEVATALEQVGCNTFIVAALEEGISLRAALPDVRIIALAGVQKGEEFAFRQHRLVPVLNSIEQMHRWRPVATEYRDAVSVLHLDTAMGRLGLTDTEWKHVREEGTLFEECRVSLIMSHLAYASSPADPRNEEQLARFQGAMHYVQGIPASLANSGGVMLMGEAYHYQLARPGCALYGIHPAGYNIDTQDDSNRAQEARASLEPASLRSDSSREHRGNAKTMLRHVATWKAPILQVRTLDHDQQVSYDGLVQCNKNTRVAAVASGYADGYLRSITDSGAYGLLRGKKVPLLGRVTMDMVLFDVTDVEAHEGDVITLLGTDGDESISIDLLAHWAGTIGYEIFTRIGPRVKREYK